MSSFTPYALGTGITVNCLALNGRVGPEDVHSLNAARRLEVCYQTIFDFGIAHKICAHMEPNLRACWI